VAGQLPPTPSDGSAFISNLGSGSYVVAAEAQGYGSASQHVTITSGPLTTVEIRLESLAGSLDGHVTDVVSGTALAGATVSLAQWTTVTDSTGHYRLEGVPPGAYSLEVRLEGYGAHQMLTIIEPRGSHKQDVTLLPVHGLLKVRVVDAATGRPIEGATISYGTVTQAAAQSAQPCADYELLLPLKRSRQYRAIRSRVSDLSPADAWEQDGIHFFVFTLDGVQGDGSPVAVFAMRAGEQEPVSAVVVRSGSENQDPEITPVAVPDEHLAALAS
jgi:hypothetical protein